MKRFCITACLALAPAAFAQSPAGLWDAKVNINGLEVPFRIEFAGKGASFKGWFFNGAERVPSTSGVLEKDHLLLRFDHYATRLEANLKDNTLQGEYGPVSKKNVPFSAVRHIQKAPLKAKVPQVDGLWEIALQSPKGESAWRLIVNQSGPELSAAILRVDGDTGALTGSYQDGKFVLSHFSGARPSLLVLTPAADGTLDVELSTPRGQNQYKAARPAEARARNLPGPADPDQHTTVKDPSDPFRFSLPDLNGKTVSNTDPRFQGKVVLVNVAGSWCPNCHDEAGFLANLYRKYRGRGLEIVALSFEEAEQLKDPVRLRAFIKQYGIEYTVLLGGEPSELHDKLPQAVNLNSWPTTFFLGRDGRVRGVHAGFPGPASGSLYREATEKFNREVEALLTENQSSSR